MKASSDHFTYLEVDDAHPVGNGGHCAGKFDHVKCAERCITNSHGCRSFQVTADSDCYVMVGTWSENSKDIRQRVWVRKGAENTRCISSVFPWKLGRSRYRHENKSLKKWFDAQKQCRKDGGELVEISSKAELDYLWEKTKPHHSIVGLRKKKVGQNLIWAWDPSNNVLKPSLWAPRQPSKESNELFGEIFFGLLNNIDGTEEKPFICECHIL